jgi:hypothetical protein
MSNQHYKRIRALKARLNPTAEVEDPIQGFNQ